MRKAVFSWLHVHANEERFILPIEDTDRQRSTQAAIRVILYGMRWLSQQYIIKVLAERLADILKKQFEQLGIDISDGPDLNKVADGYRERPQTILEMAVNSRYFFEDFDEFHIKAMKKHLRSACLDPYLRYLSEISVWKAANLSTKWQTISESAWVSSDNRLGLR